MPAQGFASKTTAADWPRTERGLRAQSGRSVPPAFHALPYLGQASSDAHVAEVAWYFDKSVACAWLQALTCQAAPQLVQKWTIRLRLPCTGTFSLFSDPLAQGLQLLNPTRNLTTVFGFCRLPSSAPSPKTKLCSGSDTP